MTSSDSPKKPLDLPPLAVEAVRIRASPHLATPAEIRALRRLPLGAQDIAKESHRRMLWFRLIEKGWAKWTVGDVLVCSTVGKGIVDETAYAREMRRRGNIGEAAMGHEVSDETRAKIGAANRRDDEAYEDECEQPQLVPSTPNPLPSEQRRAGLLDDLDECFALAKGMVGGVVSPASIASWEEWVDAVHAEVATHLERVPEEPPGQVLIQSQSTVTLPRPTDAPSSAPEEDPQAR